jgi:hypothetical protein
LELPLAVLESERVVGDFLRGVGEWLTDIVDVPVGIAVALAFGALAAWKHRRLFSGDVGPLLGQVVPALGAGAGITAALYYLGKAFSLGNPTNCGGLSRNELTGAFAFSTVIGGLVSVRAAVLVFANPKAERAPALPQPSPAPNLGLQVAGPNPDTPLVPPPDVPKPGD